MPTDLVGRFKAAALLVLLVQCWVSCRGPQPTPDSSRQAVSSVPTPVVSPSQPLRSAGPGDVRGDERLVLTFPALKELKAVWAAEPTGFPHYAEIEVVFRSDGRQRKEIIGLDLEKIEQAELAHTPNPPVVADLAEDFCRMGIAHLSVWITAPDVQEADFTLMGYDHRPKDTAGEKDAPAIQLPLRNPPGYDGPVVHKLETRFFTGNRSPYATADQVGGDTVDRRDRIDFSSLHGTYPLTLGGVLLVDLPVSPSITVTMDPEAMTGEAMLVSPRQSKVITVTLTDEQDLLITGKATGRQEVTLRVAGRDGDPAAFTVDVTAPEGATAGAPAAVVGGGTFVTAAPSLAEAPLPQGVKDGPLPWDGEWSVSGGRLQGPLEEGPVSLRLPRTDGGDDLLSLYPTAGRAGVQRETLTVLQEPLVSLASSGAGLVVATAHGVQSLPPNVWSLTLDMTVLRVAVGPSHLAVLVTAGELATGAAPPQVLVYALPEGGQPRALGVFQTNGYPTMLGWRGNELWLVYLDGRVMQAVVRGADIATRLVQPEPRKTQAMDMVAGPQGRLYLAGDHFVEEYAGQGKAAGLVRRHGVDCFVTRLMPLGGRRFVLGCAGVKVVGEKHGIKEYRPEGEAYLQEADFGGHARLGPKLSLGGAPGLVYLLAPWAGGYLAGATNDETEQRPAQVVLLSGDGVVQASLTLPPVLTGPGTNAVPWHGGVVPVVNAATVVHLRPKGAVP